MNTPSTNNQATSAIPAIQGWSAFAAATQDALARLRDQHLYRELNDTPTPGAMDLSHNDYMGLRSNHLFQDHCFQAIRGLPVGSGASRLLGGEFPVYAETELIFARWKKAVSALYFSSGYAANEAIFRILNDLLPHVVFFSDSLNHASMIDGMRLARKSREDVQVFPHHDFHALRELLQKTTADLKVIVVESLYSMDGDIYDLRSLQTLADEYQAVLVIDEAHALGVYGDHGEGLIAAQGLDHDRVISINPCGKAMAAAGAFICGPQWLREYLINTSRPFIFSTGPSPWVAKALQISIQHLQDMHREREHLRHLSHYLRERLVADGWNIGVSNSHIVPVIVGESEQALGLAQYLKDAGIWLKAIRPPTVPAQSARVRLSLRADLSLENADHIVEVLQQWRKQGLLQ